MPPKRKTTAASEGKDHDAPESGSKVVALSENLEEATTPKTRGRRPTNATTEGEVPEVTSPKTRGRNSNSNKSSAAATETEELSTSKTTTTKRKSNSNPKTVGDAEVVEAEPSPKPKGRIRKTATKVAAEEEAKEEPKAQDSKDGNEEEAEESGAKKKQSKKKKEEDQTPKTTVEPKPADIVAPEGSFVLTSWNVNGLRAALRNGFDKVYKTEPLSDGIFLQEVKSEPGNIGEGSDFAQVLAKDGYKVYLNCGTIPGYAGTAFIYRESTLKPLKIVSDNSLVADVSLKQLPPCFCVSGVGLPEALAEKLKRIRADSIVAPDSAEVESKSTTNLKWNPDQKFDEDLQKALEEAGEPFEITEEMIKNTWEVNASEGRVITVELADRFLVGCYVPNSGQTLDNLEFRTKVWEPCMLLYLKQLETMKPVIYTGDLNVAFLDIDCHSPATNKRSAGFTPQERARFGTLVSCGLTDSYRHLYGNSGKAYTFWGYRFDAKVQEKGWRLDYWIVSNSLLPKVKQVVVGTECPNLNKRERASDHAPVTLVVL